MHNREPLSSATLPSSSTIPVNTPYDTTYIAGLMQGGFMKNSP